MLLDATTDALEIILDKSVTTELNFVTYYNNYTSTSVTPSASYGTTNGTSSVNLVPSPQSNQQHQLKYSAINNVGTQDVGTKIRFNNNGSYRNLLYVYLRASESIQYTEENGWRVYDLYGGEKINAFHKLPGTIRMPEGFGTPNASTNLSLTNATCHCVYLGAADRPYSSVKLAYNVTTGLGATITFAELAIYKGNPTIGSGTTMTRLGFTDTSGVWNTTGNKLTTVTTSNMAINDELWAVFAPSSSNATPMQLRAGATDDIGVGFFQTVAATQPSTNSSISGTINTGSAQIWVAWQGVPQGT